MCLRYSSIVVAPMQHSSPRASEGLSRFPMSMPPPSSPADPAPISRCSSSMNRMTSSRLETSSRSFLMRSSKSPRYLVSATSDPIFSEYTFLPISLLGRSGAARSMVSASASAIAVFPTPGSPTRHGLFFRRRSRMRMTRRSSAARPNTGSRRSSRAISERLVDISSSTLFFFLLSMPSPPCFPSVPLASARSPLAARTSASTASRSLPSHVSRMSATASLFPSSSMARTMMRGVTRPFSTLSSLAMPPASFRRRSASSSNGRNVDDAVCFCWNI
mmetsp:Transcript_16890/g.43214  ORF Transcript_16890/g.43214 Transcript_16890/m.43214 type:complete len:275 (+) Transcript_16890:1373-2197(+)